MHISVSRALPLLAVAVLSTAACAPGTNENLRRSAAFGRSADLMSAEACTDRELLVDDSRDVDVWFDVDAAKEALEERWPEAPGALLLGIGPTDDGAGVWSVTSDIPDPGDVDALLTAFRASRRNVAVPDDGLLVFVGDERGPRPTLVDGFRSCPAELIGEEGVEARMLEVVDAFEEEADRIEIVAIRIDDSGRPLSVLYRGEGDVRLHGDSESLWLLASARFRPAFVHGIPMGALVPVTDRELGGEGLKETFIAGLDRNLFFGRAGTGAEPLGLTARWDHAGSPAAGVSPGAASRPRGLDWRLRRNASGTDGLKYFHPQRVWGSNGLVDVRNAPLVHVDVYGRRR